MKPLKITMSLSRPLPKDSEIQEGGTLQIYVGFTSAGFTVEKISIDRRKIDLRGKS